MSGSKVFNILIHAAYCRVHVNCCAPEAPNVYQDAYQDCLI